MGDLICNRKTQPFELVANTDFFEGSEDVDLAQLERLSEEKHEHILGFSLDQNDGRVLWEDFKGLSLEHLVRRHAMVLADFLGLARGVLSAVSFLHSSGVVHGALRGESVLLVENGPENYAVKIRGFGQQVSMSPGANWLGLMNYTAPEVLLGDTVSESSDIYSIGCLLYFSLCGRYPNEDSRASTGRSYEADNIVFPVSLFRSDLPLPISNWVMSFCQKDARLRPQSCAEALSALASFHIPNKIAYAPYAYQGVVGGVYARQLTRESLALKKLKDRTGSVVLFGSTKAAEKSLTLEQKSRKALEEDDEEMIDSLQNHWFSSKAGVQSESLSFGQIRENVKRGRLAAIDLVWHEELGGWKMVSECDFLKELIPQLESSVREEMPNRRSLKLLASSFSMELITGLFIGAIIAGFVFLRPDMKVVVLLCSLPFVIIGGFVCLKYREIQHGKRWLWMSLGLPLISDILFSIRHFRAAWRPVCLILLGFSVVAAFLFMEMESLSALGITEKVNTMCEGLNMSDVLK